MRDVGGVKLIGRVLNGVPGKDLKGMADEFKKKLGSGVVALIGVEDGKASAVVGVTDDLAKTYSAVELVKAGVAALGGKGGGGRPDMAQGGGPDAAKAARGAEGDRGSVGGGQMSRVVVLLAGALLLGACEQKNYPKDDAAAAQYAKDETACRAQVRQIAQQERNIEDQRRSVFEGERERFGQQDLPNTMANMGYRNNVDRLTARCMEGRGWAPKKPSLLPKLSW